MNQARRRGKVTVRDVDALSASVRDSGSSDIQLDADIIFAYLKRKLPAILSLAIGVLVGLLFAQRLAGDDTKPKDWRGGTKSPTWAVQNRLGTPRFSTVFTPSLEQRKRAFDVLASLTGHHTRYCTIESQGSYRRQVYERYEPLVGYYRGHRTSSVISSMLRRGDAATESAEANARIRISNDRRRREREKLRSGHFEGHKYFFAINLYNSFDIIPDLFSNMFKVSSILGFHNVFVSVYENGSTDQTKALLRLFDALSRSVGLRVVIRTSLRTRGAFHHRIEYLAEVRNAALAPLQELRDAEGEVFESLIFMNDVLPCVDDLLELIWQSRRQNAGITCGADYIFHDEIGQPVFYDNWVARDMNGTALENAPFESIFRDIDAQHKFARHLPIQVQSCWNGIAILDPEPMYAHPHVRFRMANLGEGECSASECSLICNDYWAAGYGRIIMVPRVKLCYDKQVWDIAHPSRRNLTIIRGYSRLGGHPEDPRSDPQDRSWFGPHDRLFRQEESELINFVQAPKHVWCWGWDGAGDIEGPDVEPVWEQLKNYTSTTKSAVSIQHDRSFEEF